MTPAVGLDQALIPPPSYHRTMAAALHVDACPNAGAALGVAGAMWRGRPPGPRAVPTATACWAGRCAAGLSRGVAVAPGAAAYVVALVLPWTGPCTRPGAPAAAFPPAGARAPWAALRKNAVNRPIDRAESGSLAAILGLSRTCGNQEDSPRRVSSTPSRLLVAIVVCLVMAGTRDQRPSQGG